MRRQRTDTGIARHFYGAFPSVRVRHFLDALDAASANEMKTVSRVGELIRLSKLDETVMQDYQHNSISRIPFLW